MRRPLGPVAVFCASNFPLAFSVAGGDTASALAAGCPVVVKGHHSHPGTAEMVGTAIQQAAGEDRHARGYLFLDLWTGIDRRTGFDLAPADSRRRLHGLACGRLGVARNCAPASGANTVLCRNEQREPGFHSAASAGGTRGADRGRAARIGDDRSGAILYKPGSGSAAGGPAGDALAAALAEKLRSTAPAPMLNDTIFKTYCDGVGTRAGVPHVNCLVGGSRRSRVRFAVTPALFETDAATFLGSPALAEEIFGPVTILVRSQDLQEMLTLARCMEPNLTSTFFMAAGDEDAARQLVAALETRVGRIVFQGYPTGLEVCHATVHGGPYPSTSDGRSTSVGGRAIDRWARPVCFQDAPESLLPLELRDGNPTGILRIVNGVRGRFDR